MGTLTIECDIGNVSDGYHTFDELYAHRVQLFLGLMLSHPEMSWVSNLHHDGSKFDGWLLAGMMLPTGDISYHVPEKVWPVFLQSGITFYDRAPRFDGHTANDVLERLTEWNLSRDG